MSRFVLLILVLCLPCTAVSATQWTETARSRHVPEFQRIRATSARVLYALQVGYKVSPTFKVLVDALETRLVFVYLRDAQCRNGQPEGCTLLDGQVGTLRYLHVHVNAKVPTRDLTVMLGHELQHALEIAEEATVVDQTSLDAFYGRIGLSNNLELQVYETAAALRVARAIRQELMAGGY